MAITTVIQKNSGLAIVDWQIDELFRYEALVKLAIVKSESKDDFFDELIKRKLGKILERREMQVDDTYCFLYHNKDIEFHEIPVPSGSPKSDARYYVWDDKTGLLLQKIPPYSKTSCNSHKITDESFYNVVGEVSICLPDEERKLNRSYHVAPYQCHRLCTLSKSAINIILMNPPGLGMSDHYHPEKCIRGLW